MHVPRIWVKESVEGTDAHGQQAQGIGWGWSESSRDEAASRARESATRVLKWLASDFVSDEPERYGYDQRLPREEIIKEYLDDAGATSGFVSRNQYGALILNTRDLMFIDVDLPKKSHAASGGGVASVFKSLFGMNTPAPEPADDPLENIRQTASRFSAFGFRVYRTHSGHRLLVTNARLLPDDEQTQELLREFQADPLYIRMCKNQQCFRARLTPKPWRCNIPMPTIKFPFEDPQTENDYRQWEQQYNEGVQGFKTCELVEVMGTETVEPEFAEFIQLHDQLCKVDAPGRLA